MLEYQLHITLDGINYHLATTLNKALCLKWDAWIYAENIIGECLAVINV